jgi:hypothetical protein
MAGVARVRRFQFDPLVLQAITVVTDPAGHACGAASAIACEGMGAPSATWVAAIFHEAST